MKKLTNFVFSFKPDISLDQVSGMEIVFVQGATRKLFTYPSATCTRDDAVINCVWKATDTLPFKAGVPIKMDTLIRVNGSDFNPETMPVEFLMTDTLFRKEEVIPDD